MNDSVLTHLACASPKQWDFSLERRRGRQLSMSISVAKRAQKHSNYRSMQNEVEQGEAQIDLSNMYSSQI